MNFNHLKNNLFQISKNTLGTIREIDSYILVKGSRSINMERVLTD
jgi:hypothetical protein